MKRRSRVTADVTKEAHDLLRASCLKFDCSKGKLIEKMIRKFCVDVEPVKSTSDELPSLPIKNKSKRFTPPTVEEVFNYCNERCNNVDAEAFVDHYTTNGWVQGKGKPVKCWKACVRTWEKNDSGKQKQLGKTSGNLSACEDFING